MVQHLIFPIRGADLMKAQHGRADLLRIRRMKKKGAPIRDITIPTGTSEGAKAVRPTRSAVSTKILPTAADTASRGAVWGPASLREI